MAAPTVNVARALCSYVEGTLMGSRWTVDLLVDGTEMQFYDTDEREPSVDMSKLAASIARALEPVAAVLIVEIDAFDAERVTSARTTDDGTPFRPWCEVYAGRVRSWGDRLARPSGSVT